MTVAVLALISTGNLSFNADESHGTNFVLQATPNPFQKAKAREVLRKLVWDRAEHSKPSVGVQCLNANDWLKVVRFSSRHQF